MIDISADLGEGAPGEDEIWPLIDSANVACGGHVGDEASMRDAAARAREHGVKLGAHPSYPDRENFGRVEMPMDAEAIADTVYAQIVRACLTVKCASLTFWGYTDGRSWISETEAGMGFATLLDDALRPKPAFYAVQRALAGR